MKTYFSTLILAVVLFVNFGCGDDAADEAGNLITSGWEKFEAHDYTGAAEDFANAIGADSSRAEAYVGVGWTALKLDQLAIASLSFSVALSLEETDDAYAGKALADLNLDDKASAINDVDAVLTITGNSVNSYTFSHDTTVTQADLLWIKARAHFLLADYAGAQTAVNVLSPSNGLNPESPTYIEELAAAIEALRLNV